MMKNEDDEEVFVVGQYKHNPVDSENTPCIQILMDGASGRSENEIILLKQVDSESRAGYKKKTLEMKLREEGMLEDKNKGVKKEINGRIEHLREIAQEKFEKFQEFRQESEFDGQGEPDEEEKKAQNNYASMQKDLERIHELCKLSDEKQWGKTPLEEEDLNGAP